MKRMLNEEIIGRNEIKRRKKWFCKIEEEAREGGF